MRIVSEDAFKIQKFPADCLIFKIFPLGLKNQKIFQHIAKIITINSHLWRPIIKAHTKNPNKPIDIIAKIMPKEPKIGF